MNRLLRPFVVVALVGAVAGLYLGSRRHTITPASGNSKLSAAPRLQAVDLEGRYIDTAAYSGKVMLINFWAAWCTPCADEIPQFVSLQEKFGSRGFQAIGISMDDKDRQLREFYRDYKMNYPVIIGNQQIAQEYGGILGLPTTLLIGRDGRIHSKHSGLADFSSLQQEIGNLLKPGN